MSMKAELTALRFNDLTAIAKHLKGGSLGFDPNRRFTRPMKENFAAWIMDEFTEGEIRAAMKDHENGLTDSGPAKPEAKAEAAPAKPAAVNDGNVSDVATAIAAALAGLKLNAGVDEAAVKALVEREFTVFAENMDGHIDSKLAALMRPNVVTVERKPTGERIEMGVQHVQFADLLALCSVRDHDGMPLNVWLAGPAGSGKTTAARNVAKALGLKFYFNGAIDTEYKLLGFTDATGKIVRRAFREAWEHGGVYLFDEVDASMPGATLALNAALANGTCDFPDGNIPRHPDCVMIAAANTWGTGATNEYVGRNKLDGAFLDRFVPMAWQYDEALEKALAGHDAWVNKVQRVRRAVGELGIRHIVSPRASYSGAAMLKHGMSEASVIEMTLRKGLTDDQWRSVRSKAAL